MSLLVLFKAGSTYNRMTWSRTCSFEGNLSIRSTPRNALVASSIPSGRPSGQVRALDAGIATTGRLSNLCLAATFSTAHATALHVATSGPINASWTQSPHNS